jgi:hypothetical protein
MISSGGKSTLAQSVKPSTADDYQNSEQSVNGMGPLGNSLNPVDIIHRANLSRGRNMGEFNEDTSSGLTSEADKFKRLQRERLLQQEQVQNQPQAESTKTPPQ